jgi:hypothetical protein
VLIEFLVSIEGDFVLKGILVGKSSLDDEDFAADFIKQLDSIDVTIIIKVLMK